MHKTKGIFLSKDLLYPTVNCLPSKRITTDTTMSGYYMFSIKQKKGINILNYLGNITIKSQQSIKRQILAKNKMKSPSIIQNSYTVRLDLLHLLTFFSNLSVLMTFLTNLSVLMMFFTNLSVLLTFFNNISILLTFFQRQTGLIKHFINGPLGKWTSCGIVCQLLAFD